MILLRNERTMRRRRPARLAVIWLLAVLVLALGWSDRGEAGAAKQPATIPDEGPRGQSNSGKSTVASSGNGRRGAGELVVRPRAELSPLAPAPDDRDPLKALHRAREDPLEKLRRAAGAGGLAQPAVQLPDATPLLIVSTLDGQLHGIDKAAGKILWSTSAGGDGIISSGAALFAPATKPGQPAPGTPKPPEWDWEDDDEDGRPSNDDGLDNDMIYTSNEEKPDVVYIAEPMGGGQLYVYQNGRAMQKLPLPIRDLVALSPFRSADGTIYIGRKTTRFLALEPYTGKVVGDYGGADADANVCAAMNPDLGGKKGECDVSEEAVYVGRTG